MEGKVEVELSLSPEKMHQKSCDVVLQLFHAELMLTVCFT